MRMILQHRVSALVIGWALVLMMPPSAHGQERFTLTDEDEWKAEEAVDPQSPEGRLNEARKALARGDAVRAENLTTQWIERFDRHPLAPEAYLLRGDALVMQREYYDSLFDYEYVARVYPGSESFVTALERELHIARIFASGTRRKMWGMRIFSGEDEAEELFIRIQERLPGSRVAELAGIDLADFYYDRRKMRLAVDAYQLFVENYPNSEFISKARKRLINAHIATFKGPEFDASGLFEADTLLTQFQRVEPAAAQQLGANAIQLRIDESVALKHLRTAQWYKRTGDYIAAERTIRRLVFQFPRSVATAEALRLVPDILENLPQSILDKAPNYAALRLAVLGPDELSAEEIEQMQQQPAVDPLPELEQNPATDVEAKEPAP